MTQAEFERASTLQYQNFEQQSHLAQQARNIALDQINANNSWSAEQAAKQMEFQERMSNTAHQREMADLKAAGLNPVLSASNGATSPAGAMAQADPSATSAMVSLMNKMLDIQNDNAKSQMALSVAAADGLSTGSGYRKSGYSSGYEAKREMSSLEKNFVILALMTQGYSYSQAKNMVELGYSIGDDAAKFLKQKSGSDGNAKTNLIDVWNFIKEGWNNLENNFSNNTALGRATMQEVNKIRKNKKASEKNVKDEIAKKGVLGAIIDGLKGLTKNYR